MLAPIKTVKNMPEEKKYERNRINILLRIIIFFCSG